ncbi:DUF1302 domain-containing protein [Halopseudomonas sp.]|uniref:DUF1302 domain-containing protein n=1 Tax=Halopseudomonas sp. TaxID=2901191 RepID=UPI003FA5CAF8
MRYTTRNALKTGLKPMVVAIAMASALPAHAVRFDIGEVQGQFDSQMSIGASWGTSDIEDDFVWAGNGGNANAGNSDDNRLNFDKGETFSKIFKGIHDLSLQYGDTGVFLRGKYWYDFELKDEHRNLYDISDENRKTAAQASGVQLLDAFLYHNYSIGDKPGSVRVGRQVVSWGESTFIQNGINAINPIDVAAFRRPGAEVKEGLIPVNMLFLSQSLTDNLGMEMFYQLEWDQTVLDNCGTFFSFTDTVADGCNYVGVQGTQNNANSAGVFAYVPRGADRDARDDGQFGVSFRYYAENLNQTEFGVYAMNYHSRNPVYSTSLNAVGAPAGFHGVPVAQVPGVVAGSSYFIEYPEDIRLYGVSFQTNIGTTAVSGEVSYRPNQPLQINSNDLTGAVLGVPNPAVAEIGSDGDLHGYKRLPVTQAQVTVLNFIDNVLGAERLTLIGEAGYNYISGIDNGAGELRYGRDSLYGSGELTTPGVCEAGAVDPSECNDDGFYTDNSWGYRLVAALDYNGFAGIALKPALAFSHDVDGYGPNFNEGAMAANLGLTAVYNNKYNASINYTNFFGGDYNANTDRDFVAVSLGVNF